MRKKNREALICEIDTVEKNMAREELMKKSLEEEKNFISSANYYGERKERLIRIDNMLKKINERIRRNKTLIKINKLKIKRIELEDELSEINKELMGLKGWFFEPRYNCVTLYSEYELIEKDGENMKTRKKRNTKKYSKMILEQKTDEEKKTIAEQKTDEKPDEILEHYDYYFFEKVFKIERAYVEDNEKYDILKRMMSRLPRNLVESSRKYVPPVVDFMMKSDLNDSVCKCFQRTTLEDFAKEYPRVYSMYEKLDVNSKTIIKRLGFSRDFSVFWINCLHYFGSTGSLKDIDGRPKLQFKWVKELEMDDELSKK